MMKHSRFEQQGLTLVELMVALAVGLMISLAVFTVLVESKGMQRSLTSTNDINQSGALAMSVMDKLVRSAGSGFRAASDVYGCQLFASSNNTQVLPRSTALPSPFSKVNPGGGALLTFRLAPVLILPNQTTPAAGGAKSDVLVVMSGTSGRGDMPISFSETTPITGTTLPTVNSLGLQSNDLVLIADKNAASPVGNCMIQQIAASFANVDTATSVGLGGTYAKATIGTATLTDFSNQSLVINLGNAVTNFPQFQLIGVGDANTLSRYDLLNGTTEDMADGVFEMHALYGIDKNNDGIVADNEWVPPTDPTYSLASLMAGTPAAAAQLGQIKAIRIGLIMRTQLRRWDAGSTTLPPMFSGVTNGGTDLTYTHAPLTDAQKRFRYRVIESTIPVRNGLF